MTNMTISTSGVLLRAAEICKTKRDAKHLDFPLRQLYEHLSLIKNTPESERVAMLERFFAVWVDLDQDAWT